MQTLRSGLAERVVQAAPVGVVLSLAAFMVERDGGYSITVWAPVGLVVVAVGVTIAVSAGGLAAGVPRATLAAVGSLAAFVAFELATIGWAAVRGDAWHGADRDLVYLAAFALLACWPLTTGALWPVLLVFAAVVTAEGVRTVEQIVHSSHPADFAIGTRLSEPLGYPNATGALYMVLVWLLLGLASRRWLPAPARGAALGLAVVDATLNLLTESRGSVFTLPLVVVVAFLVVPGRLRLAAALLVALAAFAPVVRPVLRVYGSAPESLSSTLARAIDLGLVFGAVAAGGGWLVAGIDERWTPSPRIVRAAAASLAAAAAVALLAVVALTTPWSRVGDAWHSFKYSGEPTGAASHFGGLGSARYDVWRVGLIEFRRHPAAGIGADNFLVPYLQQRRSGQQPIFPHSLAVRLLSQTGIVGTLLFCAFLALSLRTALRIPPGRQRELAAILVVGASVWLLHGLVDWLWEMPMLGLFGVTLLALAQALAPRHPRPGLDRLRGLRRAAAAAVGVAAAGAAASLVFPWLAAREVARGGAQWTSSPAAAFSTLRRAHDLDPLSDEADLVAGAIASRLHRYPLMRERFAAAVARSPDDWYANLELGIAASLTGRHDEAAAALEAAERLNPGDLLVRSVVADFRAGRRIDSDAVDRAAAGS